MRRRTRRLGPGRTGLLIGGTAGLVWVVAACMGPATALGLSPTTGRAPAAATPTAAVARPSNPTPTAIPAVLVPLATPTSVSAPVPPPTPGTSVGDLLNGLRTDLATQWVQNSVDTPLMSGPDDSTTLFTTLPQGTALKRLDTRGDWVSVYYTGDGDTRQPGPGWVHATDVTSMVTPSVWLSTSASATLWSDATSSATAGQVVPTGTRLEVETPNPIQGTRVHVQTPGDGRSVPPAEGWVEAGQATRTDPLPASGIPWAFPNVLKAQVRLPVRYRTQLDGSSYAGANCGPTALGMALEAFDVKIDPPDLRSEVLTAQDDDASNDEEGSYIWSLAQVAQGHGVKPLGLYETDGTTFHQWTVDEVKQQVANHHPVIVQVRYRSLPRREDSLYYGDHYVVITGLLGNDLLYDDPIGGPSPNEGPGWDRMMSPDQLAKAMNASDGRYAYAAFALSK
ncbi:MAG: C39 family peptidase [Chloroflexi bacterium]|nr:C39 family peptidase [Chloroflexota bacterium]